MMPASYAQNYEITREPKEEWLAICTDHEVPWMGEPRDVKDDAYREAFQHNQQHHGGHAVIPAHEMMDESLEKLEKSRAYSYKVERQAKYTALALIPFSGIMYGLVIYGSVFMAFAVTMMAGALVNMGRTWGKIYARNQIAERDHQNLKESIANMVEGP